MPSEKSSYLNRGPSAPLDWTDLKAHLSGFEHEHLVELLWMSAQNNPALWKALIASIAMQLAEGDWEATKAAIDYAFYFMRRKHSFDFVHNCCSGRFGNKYVLFNALDGCCDR